MTAPPLATVVAVGADGYAAALAYAVDHARRAQQPLHLVHVLQLPAGEASAGGYRGLTDAARTVLAEAVTEAEMAAGPGTAVTAELIDGGLVVPDLVRCSRAASLLVLQHRELGLLLRVFSGSTAQGAAGRATVPVVSVPERWSGARPGDPVVAAVQDPADAQVLLRLALDEARSRGVGLVVLHALGLGAGPDGADVALDGTVVEEWEEEARRELDAALLPFRAEYPKVSISLTARHTRPAQAVLEAADGAALMVLGRRHRLLPLGSHLGPVARAALAHAACPVLIAPEPDTGHPGRRRRHAAAAG